MNGIVNDVVNGKGNETDLQFFDLTKCFDSMWLKETLNDVYDTGVKNDLLVLMYETNKKCKLAIKTPVGTTSREEIKEIVMQGGVLGSIECSLQMDALGKECVTNGENTYEYKKCLNVPPLGFVDDIAGASKCGQDSLELNIKTQEFLN